MTSFRTDFPAQPADFSIGHTDRLLLVGSCFSEHIGARLAAGKIPVLVNPFGIVYNPFSIARCLERLRAGDRHFAAADLFENQGLWHSWEHHSRFSQPDRQATLDALNVAYTASVRALRQANRLLLTLGTADVFLLRATEKIVANNHKMPAALFRSRRLGVDEIVYDLGNLLHEIKAGQPDLQVILTVSPVRHLRAGAVENQRSKATLVLACAELAQLPFVHYFPAYELQLDDLRDYRFYAPDMVHPNAVAIDYIWQHFAATFFSPDTQRLIRQIEQIQTAVQHRPFHQHSAQHRAFATAQLAAIAALTAVQPQLDFVQETAHFRQFV